MMNSTVEAKLTTNQQHLAKGTMATKITDVFGKPAYMGSQLDNLQSTQQPGFAQLMPGIVMGGSGGSSSSSKATTTPVVEDQSAADDVSIQPVAEPDTPQYYLGYDGDGPREGQVLWFLVQVTGEGDEVTLSHGWQAF